MKRLLITTLVMLFSKVGMADHHVVSLEELSALFGWDMETTEIQTEKVGEGLYVLFGVGGNIAVSIGQDGVLVVDDQFPQMMPKINDAIAKIGGGPVDYAINTHWHFDHAQGNLALGPMGAAIIAQLNARDDMAAGGMINMVIAKYKQDAYPPKALPIFTYEDGMQMHFNDERVDLMHFGPAHTSGDSAVIFRKHNAVHTGDVFNNAGYPFIDADNGGEIDGMIAFCQSILDELKPGGIIIPGHGEITNAMALEKYIIMLKTVRNRVNTLIDEGKSLEQIKAAKVTADFDVEYGDEAASLGFINRVYTSLIINR
jgi:glyoxylase-like metal-dependent hydrolase (beta-lactamase superfamily II)